MSQWLLHLSTGPLILFKLTPFSSPSISKPCTITHAVVVAANQACSAPPIITNSWHGVQGCATTALLVLVKGTTALLLLVVGGLVGGPA